MADAPSGGGTWEPFEIVLVILLVIGLLMHLQGAKSTTSTTPTKPVATTPAPDMCGLTLARPHALEKAYGFVTIVGTTYGCTWQSTDTVALYAQVIDAKGKPVSAYTAIPAINIQTGQTSFSSTVTLNGQPPKGKGYLILVPAQEHTAQAVNLRIPITFAQ